MATGGRDLERMLGDPKVAIRSMTLPLIVSYLVVQIDIFANITWCSGLGPEASSAVSAISPLYWIVSGIGTGIGIGAATAIARCLGRNDPETGGRLASQTVTLSLIVGVAVTPVMLLSIGLMVDLMGVSDVEAECYDYMVPQVLASMFVIMDGTVSGIMRSEGAAKKSMVVLLMSAAITIVLDPILIYGLDMGLAGSGWATAIGAAASALLGLWWYHSGTMALRLSRAHMRPHWGDMRSILFVGVPRATESVLISIMSMVQQIFVVACGGTIAAMFYSIPWRFVSFAQVVSQAVGSAMIPVCSAALGGGDARKARTGFRYSLTLTVVTMLSIAAVLLVFADWVIIPFSYSESMEPYRETFAHVLRIYALAIPFIGMIDIGSSVLQSLRMAQVSMVSSFARNILIIVMLFFASTVSLDAVYWSLFAAEVVGAALMLWLAKSGYKHYTHMRYPEPKDRSRPSRRDVPVHLRG